MSFVHTINPQAQRLRSIFLIAGLANFFRISGNVQFIPIEFLAVVIAIATLFANNKESLDSTDMHYLKFSNLFCFTSITHQLFIDWINHVSGLETIKSVAQVIVLWALFRIAVLFLRTDVMRFIYYLIGLQLSIILQLLINPTIYMTAEPWKFALGPVATSTIFILLSRATRKTLPFLGVTILIILDFLLGARSLALFTIFTILLSLVSTNKKSQSIPKFFFTIITIVTLLFVTERVYFTLSTNGTFGVKQQSKALDQYAAGPILLTARSEISFEMAAIKIHPIFGAGSNPKVTYNHLNETQLINSKLGVKTELTNSYKEAVKTGILPVHSMIFSAWIENGLVVFLFWAIILIWVFRRTFDTVSNSSPPLRYFAIYMGIYTLWSIPFSPLGAGSRMDLAVGLSALLIQSKNRKKE